METQVIVVPKLIPIDFCHMYTHVLMRHAEIFQQTQEKQGDPQVPNALTIMDHEVMFETLQERLWTKIEQVVGEELIPTYSYARLYQNGNTLEKHTDRPACEVSVTLQLGRSHHYSWPIYMGGKRFDLNEGDAVIYPGMDVEHWRDECKGPEGYYSGQVFMHYVKANGEHTDQAGDGKSNRQIYSYRKNRTFAMESK